MKDLKKMVPYIIISIFIFYGVSISGMIWNYDINYTIIALMVVFPLSFIMIGAIFVLRYKFIWYFPLITGILFIPIAFIYYNSSALIYVTVYTVSTLVGSILGIAISRIIEIIKIK